MARLGRALAVVMGAAVLAGGLAPDAAPAASPTAASTSPSTGGASDVHSGHANRNLMGVAPPADRPRVRAGRDQYTPPDVTDGVHSVLVVPLARTAGEESDALLTQLDASIQEVATIWKTGSRGTIKVRPRRLVWKRVAYSSCSLPGIVPTADAVVKQGGVDPNAYDSVVYFAPACGGGGVAWMPGGRALVFDPSTRTMSHELGHNLGLDHAATFTCPEGNDPTRCNELGDQVDEYGDIWDVMGGGLSLPGDDVRGLFSGAALDRLGWLAADDRITAANGPAVLAHLGSATGTRVLRIPTSGGHLYVDYRRATGVDAWIPSNHPLGGGVQVRFVGPVLPHPGQGLLTNGDAEATVYGYGDPTVFLRVGDRLQTGRAGVTIRVDAITDDTATVVLRSSPPGKVRFVTATSPSATALSVRVEPNGFGVEPRDYTIRHVGGATITSRKPVATFTGLTPCSNVTFEATGSNAAGSSVPVTSPTYQVGRFTKPTVTAEYGWTGSQWALRVRFTGTVADCKRITGYRVSASSPYTGPIGTRTVGASARAADLPISFITSPTKVTVTALAADGTTAVGTVTI